MQFRVGLGMGVTYAWSVENMNWSWFRTHLRPGMTVYDVGANRGQMALFLARAVGSTGAVVSFESVADVYHELVANVTLNKLTNVKTINAAAADVDGELTFAFDPGRPTEGKLDDCEPDRPLPAARTVTVNAVRLDGVAGAESGPHFVKIDVEGGARRVLAGAVRVLRECRPVLYVELHGPEEQAAVRDYVQGNGYTIRTLAGEDVPDPTVGSANPLWCVPPVAGA